MTRSVTGFLRVFHDRSYPPGNERHTDRKTRRSGHRTVPATLTTVSDGPLSQASTSAMRAAALSIARCSNSANSRTFAS